MTAVEVTFIVRAGKEPAREAMASRCRSSSRSIR